MIVKDGNISYSASVEQCSAHGIRPSLRFIFFGDMYYCLKLITVKGQALSVVPLADLMCESAC